MVRELISAIRNTIAKLNLSRKVVAQGTTAILLYFAGLIAAAIGVSIPAAVLAVLPVVAGLIAGYLVPEKQPPPAGENSLSTPE